MFRGSKRLLCGLFLVLLLTGCAAPAVQEGTAMGQLNDPLAWRQLGSNRYTQPTQAAETLTGYDTQGFALLLENDTLAVYFRSETGAIRVLDKRSGYVWGMMESDQPEDLNQRWARIANSLVLVEAFSAEDKLEFTGVSELECRLQGQQAEMEVYLEDWELGFTFTMALTDEALTFALEDDTIREDGDYRLSSITFAPFLGAVRGDSVPGYIFVPDGCGALMRFLSPRNYLQGYDMRIYGDDYAIDEGTDSTEQVASLPLLGITHGEGQNAFLAVAEQGEEYGRIVAEPAGLICDYNRGNVKFVYRQLYQQPISQVGVGVQMVQQTPNVVNPRISYHFLTGDDAGYTGMARKYQALLMDQGVLTQASPEGTVPLQVDLLAADVEKQFIGSSVLEITGQELVDVIRQELTADGVAGLQLGLLGWQKGGLNGYDKTEAWPGSVYDGVTQLGAALHLGTFSAKEGQFSQRQEGGISLSQSLVVREGAEEAYLSDTYYLKPAAALEALAGQVQALQQKEGVILDDLGLLYGEYLVGHEVSRSQVLQQVCDTAAALQESLGDLAITRPNAYLFGVLGQYHQIPMVSSQFLFETDCVPFLQMVLSGCVEMFAPYVNQGFFSQLDVLKMIDYNCYPSYLLTEQDNYALRHTPSSQLGSTQYEAWRQHIADTYDQVSRVLGCVRGQRLLDRQVPEQGVVLNVYENGVIYVNYNAESRTAPDGTELAAQSAVYREGGLVE